MQEISNDQANVNEQPVEIEVSIAEFDELVEDKKALDRLLANDDYKRIIGKMFLVDDKARLVDLIGSRNRAAIAEEGIIINKIKAKVYLSQWIEGTAQALDGIDNPEQRVELLASLQAEG